MMRFRGAMNVIGMMPALLLLAACSSSPAWVEKGSGYMNEKNGKAFHGVGGVSGVQNEPLAREAADNRARADLAKVVETYTSYLMRDYATSTTAGDFTKFGEEQAVERALKTFVSTNLSGVAVVDRWEKNEKSGKTIYSLAKMDLETFKEQVGRLQELNAAARDFVRKNAEQAFERLQEEEEKRGHSR